MPQLMSLIAGGPEFKNMDSWAFGIAIAVVLFVILCYVLYSKSKKTFQELLKQRLEAATYLYWDARPDQTPTSAGTKHLRQEPIRTKPPATAAPIA
jgi:hypothetical protein